MVNRRFVAREELVSELKLQLALWLKRLEQDGIFYHNIEFQYPLITGRTDMQKT